MFFGEFIIFKNFNNKDLLEIWLTEILIAADAKKCSLLFAIYLIDSGT